MATARPPWYRELKLEVEDSPNSAGVVIDAIRCAKIAKDRGLGGPLLGPSSYFMKSPPVQYTEDVAREKVEDFIVGRNGMDLDGHHATKAEHAGQGDERDE